MAANSQPTPTAPGPYCSQCSESRAVVRECEANTAGSIVRQTYLYPAHVPAKLPR